MLSLPLWASALISLATSFFKGWLARLSADRASREAGAAQARAEQSERARAAEAALAEIAAQPSEMPTTLSRLDGGTA